MLPSSCPTNSVLIVCGPVSGTIDKNIVAYNCIIINKYLGFSRIVLIIVLNVIFHRFISTLDIAATNLKTDNRECIK